MPNEGGQGYDVIVVGSGGAGGPLAARLSEDGDRQVLLIEAGKDAPTLADFPQHVVSAGVMSGNMPGRPQNWAFVADLTPELRYTVARGKILGGSTTINGTYFVRARREDFDRWVAAGNPAWSYESVLPYYRKLETDREYGSTAIHGGSGPVPVTRNLDRPHELTPVFQGAAQEMGFLDEPDKNAQDPAGVGPLPVNAIDGIRFNTGLTHVNPARQRSNLTVRAETVVRRIVFNRTQVVGVEVAHNGRREMIHAREVVLAAGAINTPHLLQLSGIGPAAELAQFDVPLVVDLPGVGVGFADHPDLGVGWQPKRKLHARDQQYVFQSVLNFNSDGWSGNGDLEILPAIKSSADYMLIGDSRLRTVADLTMRSGRTLKALRELSKKRFVRQVMHARDLSFYVAVQQADSRGSVRLASADPEDRPRIQYNYLQSESDLVRMRQAIRTAVELLHTRAYAPYFDKLTELDKAVLSDNKALNAWARAHLATAIHACGSARMGPESDAAAVADQYGRVYGVTGLRIADTSLLPDAPSRGPAATAIMLGERIADFMRRGDSPGNE